MGIWKKKEGVGTRIAKSEEPNSQTRTQRTPNLIKKNQNQNQSFSIKIQIIFKKELKLEENSTQHWFELRTPCGTKGGPYH